MEETFTSLLDPCNPVSRTPARLIQESLAQNLTIARDDDGMTIIRGRSTSTDRQIRVYQAARWILITASALAALTLATLTLTTR